MARRHIRESNLCSRCNEAPESICHALFDCVEPRNLWRTSPFYSMIDDAPKQSFDEFFQWIHAHTTAAELPLLCASIWACWVDRNKQIMENSSSNPMNLSTGFIKMVMDYNIYAQKVFTSHFPRLPCAVSWQPPNQGWIKINFDAYIGHGCRRGLGVVCRDDQGDVLLTGTRLCQANWDVEASEAMAAKYGLEIARRMGYDQIHLEGDALNVISAISNRIAGRAPIHLIYDSIISMLDSFADVKFSFVRRGGNTVAHMVARWETEYGREKVCMAPFPVCLRTLIELDLS
ncbi:unnamed protein product [Amaranthus hypochondriacus]